MKKKSKSKKPSDGKILSKGIRSFINDMVNHDTENGIIYRCPFCSKKPKIVYLSFPVAEWYASCCTPTHYVRVNAKTRAGVIKRWNRNG